MTGAPGMWERRVTFTWCPRCKRSTWHAVGQHFRRCEECWREAYMVAPGRT